MAAGITGELFLIWRLKDGGGRNHWLMSCSGSDVLVEGWRIVLDLAVELLGGNRW